MLAGVDMIHAPYRGAGQALTDLIGGQVQVLFLSMLASIEHVRAGKLHALAVSTASVLKCCQIFRPCANSSQAMKRPRGGNIGVPRNTPVEIVDMLNKEINAALADARMRKRLEDDGANVLLGARGLREAHRRRDREMGEGDPGGPRQAGMTLGAPTFHCVCPHRIGNLRHKPFDEALRI